MSETTLDKTELAHKAINDKKVLDQLIEALSGSSRRERQNAAAALGIVSKTNPELLAAHIPAFVDALNRPEAQTRWECLDVLTACIDIESHLVDKAVLGAETALFDEDSGPVRLAAMRFLCKLASTTTLRSEKLWPLIDEAIQCYHGDLEFSNMLAAVTEFSLGKISPSVKEQLASRMKFDAENGKGGLKRKAQQIVANVTS